VYEKENILKEIPINFMIITDSDRIRYKLKRWNKTGYDFPFHSTLGYKNKYLELDGSFKLIILMQEKWDYSILEKFAMKSVKMNPDVWVITDEDGMNVRDILQLIYYWYQKKTRTGFYNIEFINKKRHYNKTIGK